MPASYQNRYRKLFKIACLLSKQVNGKIEILVCFFGRFFFCYYIVPLHKITELENDKSFSTTPANTEELLHQMNQLPSKIFLSWPKSILGMYQV